ncbi:MAG: hypothetical protein COB07_12810 [Sulfurovum sp.]|nr:MAG: hypothetical protein COB07_12810 [Sulfurovum sp.]
MGACKACNEIFGAMDLENGLCKECISQGYVMKKVKPVEEKSTVENESASKLMTCRVCDKEISRTAKQCPYCGEEYLTNKNDKEIGKLAKEYANSGSKSRFTSFILTALLGNLGLFYASIFAGLGLLIFNFLLVVSVMSKVDDPQNVSATGILILLFTWYILPILWGDRVIAKQKRKLLAEAKLMTS